MRVDMATGEVLDVEPSVARGASATRAAEGEAPPLLTGGESAARAYKGEAVVDWLSFTFMEWSPKTIVQMMRDLIGAWSGRGGDAIGAEEGNGLHGFKHSVTLYTWHDHQSIVLGVVAWGGEAQKGRAYVSLNGTYCSLVGADRWQVVRGWLGSVRGTVTRCDLAVDALHGEFTVDDAAEWYREGSFNAGGRMPRHSTEGDWLSPESRGGRTLYVGRRENGKFARIYEKGKQLGDASSPWTRFEVELKNRDRDIPHDIITRPTEYFAGTYKLAANLVDAGAARIKTLQAEGEISLERLRSSCRTAYGKLMHVLKFTTPDHVSLIDELAVEGFPKRLAKAALSKILEEHARRAPPDTGETS